LLACLSWTLSPVDLGRWEDVWPIAVAGIVNAVSLAYSVMALLDRRRHVLFARRLARRGNWDDLSALGVPSARVEWAAVGSLVAYAATVAVLFWGDIGDCPQIRGALVDEAHKVSPRLLRWGEGVHTLATGMTLGVPIALGASVVLPWLAALRFEARGLLRAAELAACPSRQAMSTYRSSTDESDVIRCWLQFPGPRPKRLVLAAGVWFSLVILPAAVGAHRFLAGLVMSTNNRPWDGTLSMNTRILEDIASGRTGIDAAFAVAAIGVLASGAVLGRALLDPLEQRKAGGCPARAGARGWLVSGGALLLALGAVVVAEPLRQENANPPTLPASNQTYQAPSFYHSLEGRAPDPWPDSPMIDVTEMSVDGAPTQRERELRELLTNKRALWEQIMPGEPYAGRLTLTGDPGTPTELVERALRAAWDSGHRDVSLAFVHQEELDRPLLELELTTTTAARFRLVRAGDEALDTRQYVWFWEFAEEVRRQRRQGREVTVKVTPETSLALEVGSPLLEEGGHAFGLVLGPE